MKKITFARRTAFVLACLFMVFLPIMSQADAVSASPISESHKEPLNADRYRLGSGDVISVHVFGQPDMDQDKVQIPDSGMMTFPFGRINVIGMSLHELATAIDDGLRDGYLIAPSVSVTIDQYRDFYIYGQVERPGGYPFQPGLTLRKAVSIAGGFKVRASEGNIYVVRETDPTQSSQKIGMNSPIYPGDTVTVGSSFF